MALWNIFLWLLVGVLAFIIGLSSVERRLNPAPVSNLPNSSEKLFADIAEESSPPISEIGDEEYISEFALPNDELEEEIIETKKTSKAPKFVTISCPECNEEMKVPKSDGLQNVKCEKCGLSGESEL